MWKFIKWDLGMVFLLGCCCMSFAVAEAFDKAATTKKIQSILNKGSKTKKYDKEFSEILALGPDVVPSLIEIFHNPEIDWNERWIVGMVLGRYQTNDSRKALEKGLKDSFPTIRMASAKALGSMGNLSSAPILRRALSDKAMIVRSAVALAIGQLKDRGAIDSLSKELFAKRNFNRGKSFWVREDIIDALGNIGDAQALPILKKTLNEKETNIQLKTCLALSKIDREAGRKIKRATGSKCAERWNAYYKKLAT
ncbi:MAG: HEAT repeat domain-containing protein [Bdellovibrionales bacterium]|nr:HEAT repeat domain-containing protein [Bdellovibrionales bacterium]